MELPKNITQIGQSDNTCKIYVEDYVVSYIKQLNHLAESKEMAVAMYGVRKEEAGMSYLFFYGAAKLDFLQKETRHLSQAQQQEVERLRRKYFEDYVFLGYRLLNGEMVEGFHIYDQGICRYIKGYAQFYEKNDSMLAFLLEVRKEEIQPEYVDIEKYTRKQEELTQRNRDARDQLSGGSRHRLDEGLSMERGNAMEQGSSIEKGSSIEQGSSMNQGSYMDQRNSMERGNSLDQGHFMEHKSSMEEDILPVRHHGKYRSAHRENVSKERGREYGVHKDANKAPSIYASRFKVSIVATFVFLCAVGLLFMGNEEGMDSIKVAARQLMDTITDKKLPDTIETLGDGENKDVIITEDRLTYALEQENLNNPDVSQVNALPGQIQNEGNVGEGQTSQEIPLPQQQLPTEMEIPEEITPPEQQLPSNIQNPVEVIPPVEPQEQTPVEPQAPAVPEPVAYTIVEGDTLIGISLRTYGKESMVKDICVINSITNPDDIKVGQKILLP